MIDTTKLIQELVRLAIEKSLFITYNTDNCWLLIDSEEAIFLNQDIKHERARTQLQAAIDIIKEL